eukprot:CAMPEP_0169427988 /NCGR_PEP_ID=MMETSP1042-20121227/1083_1 /TAXON_ID=464988 /ORGANISM="Hemiselmis andersenii, Strain CCMP1180" /LENGTH=358 /DNA_ID=CAMNT_0009538121 /DNA_START=29 /DNA_END=1102 /DNA_ORIENTATION=-
MSSVSFNADLSCVVCAGPTGFGVFSTSPYMRLAWQATEEGGFNFAEMFERTNMLLLVGSVVSPAGFSDSSAVLWDHKRAERVLEITLPSVITGVSCTIGTIVVALEYRVAIYSVSQDFSSVAFERSVETVHNPWGIIALSPLGGERSSIACPGPRVGSIRVLIAKGECAELVGPGRAGRGERLVENAHKQLLSCLALNGDGSLLASASQAGTLVRLWATSQTDRPTLLRELRRGTLEADISHIAFSRSSSVLSCSSDAGTIHLFSLEGGDQAGQQSGIAASVLASVQGGQRSFARYDIGVRDPSVLCGVTDTGLVAVTSQGGVHVVTIDAEAPPESRCSLVSCSQLALDGEEPTTDAG